jgi:hypothetical protein
MPGGGIIILHAPTLTVTGTITSNGDSYGSGVVWEGNNGGSGAGGSILLRATTATLGTDLVITPGGIQTDPIGCPQGSPIAGAGAGGVGRIAIGATTITGTTNPTYTSITAP